MRRGKGQYLINLFAHAVPVVADLVHRFRAAQSAVDVVVDVLEGVAVLVQRIEKDLVFGGRPTARLPAAIIDPRPVPNKSRARLAALSKPLHTPDALVMADVRPPALLCAPDALVLADARPPSLLASAPLALVLLRLRLLLHGYARAEPRVVVRQHQVHRALGPALLASAPSALVLADTRPPHSLHRLL